MLSHASFESFVENGHFLSLESAISMCVIESFQTGISIWKETFFTSWKMFNLWVNVKAKFFDILFILLSII